MLSAITFSAPFVLAALIFLPAIYVLLRFTPPQPQKIWFAPLWLISFTKKQHTPHATPWWLLVLRLLIATFIIFALSEPKIKADSEQISLSAPPIIILDNGWESAKYWPEMQEQAQLILTLSEEQKLPVMLLSTSEGGDQEFYYAEKQKATEKLKTLKPLPYSPARGNLLNPLENALKRSANAQVIFITNSVNEKTTEEFLHFLNTQPNLKTTVLQNNSTSFVLITAVENHNTGLNAKLLRLGSSANNGRVTALDKKLREVATTNFEFSSPETTIQFNLPANIRNDISLLKVEGENTAASTYLLDSQSSRKSVGLYSGNIKESTPTLLSPLFILGQALQDFADIIPASQASYQTVQQFVKDRLQVIFLADSGAPPKDLHQDLSNWLNDGGVLIRFAGLKTANNDEEQDPFLPVKLRPNIRIFGGELSWEKPKRLGRVLSSSPLAGIDLPQDVTVNKQVLAINDPALQEKTWLELEDGTPLITAEQRGKGTIILIHTTADAVWSNLPLSGFFLELCKRLINISAITSGDMRTSENINISHADALLKPFKILNAYGVTENPSRDAESLKKTELKTTITKRNVYPGFYGDVSHALALNVLNQQPLPDLINFKKFSTIEIQNFQSSNTSNLKPLLLSLATLLFLLDCAAMLFLRGQIKLKFMAQIFLVALSLQPFPAHAQQNVNNSDAALVKAANTTRFGYVLTGNPQIDHITEAGLRGLNKTLAERTAIEPDEPAALDLSRDDLAFYPLIYWPIDASMKKPTAAELLKIEAYMKNGGTVLFDTRDKADSITGSSTHMSLLKAILQGMNIPILEPVPQDHVLTKTFYLLDRFPGRYEDGSLWVERSEPNKPGEQRPVRLADGVSPIIITNSDFAGAWARDENGEPLLPVFGQSEKQRELANRAGVNIVIYLLTGNYKSDQVHVPDLLQRLGQ